ncbi:MAG: sulfotransferase domain-containing protein [Ilumatobacteraceae bacterium]
MNVNAMDELVLYRGVFVDSERWGRFEHRPGDIVISTPPKSGTTWTQMLCALMIFDGPSFPAKLDAMSPWLDMRIRSEDEVFDIYDRQTHRRFIKTHTPLDGLPLRDDVYYVVVGRDPRDVLISWEHHMENIDGGVVFQHRAEAVGVDDLDEFEPPAPPEPDPAVRFRNFVDREWSPTELMSLANVLHHLDTGWNHRHDANVGLFHFLDYRRDLVGDMLRLSELCGFDRDPARLAVLAPEAGIERMRDRADEVAPDISKSEHWRDPARFFRSGATGEWIERTTPEDRARYDERVAELVPTELARWAHEGGTDGRAR